MTASAHSTAQQPAQQHTKPAHMPFVAVFPLRRAIAVTLVVSVTSAAAFMVAFTVAFAFA